MSELFIGDNEFEMNRSFFSLTGTTYRHHQTYLTMDLNRFRYRINIPVIEHLHKVIFHLNILILIIIYKKKKQNNNNKNMKLNIRHFN